MNDITTRADIDSLIRDFYTKVRADKYLGPIFNLVIQSDDIWEHHFEKLIDFWDANLLKGAKYDGRPVGLHLWVDNLTQRKITELHFETWLALWHETIDEKFNGTCAELAKSRAVSMGDTFYAKIMDVRAQIQERMKNAE